MQPHRSGIVGRIVLVDVRRPGTEHDQLDHGGAGPGMGGLHSFGCALAAEAGDTVPLAELLDETD